MTEQYDPLALRIIWNNTPPVTPFMGYRDLYVFPEPEFPFGRKGLALMSAWEDLGVPGEAVGVLILDGDVAIDPHDNREMHNHIWNDPTCVWVAPVKIWPISHLGKNWVYGHGKGGQFTQEDVDDPDMFSFSFTYLPALLLKSLMEDDQRMAYWAYPQVDKNTWEYAQKLDIPVKVARNCQPKHMHW